MNAVWSLSLSLTLFRPPIFISQLKCNIWKSSKHNNVQIKDALMTGVSRACRTEEAKSFPWPLSTHKTELSRKNAHVHTPHTVLYTLSHTRYITSYSYTTQYTDTYSCIHLMILQRSHWSRPIYGFPQNPTVDCSYCVRFINIYKTIIYYCYTIIIPRS